jgi:hypothetical protein
VAGGGLGTRRFEAADPTDGRARTHGVTLGVRLPLGVFSVGDRPLTAYRPGAEKAILLPIEVEQSGLDIAAG